MSAFDDKLQEAIKDESQKFEIFYRWIEDHMPPAFFEEVDAEKLRLITHSLMEFPLQDYFSHINIGNQAFCLCLDSPHADLHILNQYQMRRIKNYRSFVSNAKIPSPKISVPLRIAIIGFSEYAAEIKVTEPLLAKDSQGKVFEDLKTRNPKVTEPEFQALLGQLNASFLRAVPSERLVIALDMFFRAKERDSCQYEIRYNEDLEGNTKKPSLQVIFAWKGVSNQSFLYKMAKLIHRHNLSIHRVNAINIDPYSGKNILLMSIAIHGITGKSAKEEADMDDFLQELVTLKYFEGMEDVEKIFVESGILRGNLGNLVKTMSYFIHQALVHFDMNAYSFLHVEESLCRHPELIRCLMEAFEYKFHPKNNNMKSYSETLATFLKRVSEIDTGNEPNDIRCKNVLRQASSFIDSTLKTNFYRNNKTAHCFRLDPSHLKTLPYDTQDKFPSLPYAIYFMKGFHFLGFHIRFKDLARGGLRTIIPRSMESMLAERNNVFSECYNLGYTQQKKNKDIPEGGAKGVIFLEPFIHLKEEIEILRKELLVAELKEDEIEKKLKTYSDTKKLEHLHQSQRAYIESFITLLNCNADGTLKAKHIVDYLKKPEYVYLGPDENMHNEMIEWIAEYSKKSEYKPGIAFISSKPSLGINHKEFGVTSSGVNVYMEETLKYLGINPLKDVFTLKMSGGPDGDVAGNQMLNLLRFYPKTARLLTTIDISGTIFDPNGLDLTEIQNLFLKQKPICDYPPEKLSKGGFLLDVRIKRQKEANLYETLCKKNVDGKLTEEWISDNDMNHILRYTVHQTPADIFIPGGGRPKTLNEMNTKEFCDEEGHPSAKAIVEGANLYLTQPARRILEKLGVLIIKDSSANKGGVICSSFEVLSNLCLTPEEFLLEKPHLTKEILAVIENKSKDEALTLLNTHKTSGGFLTDISEQISKQINDYIDKILTFLESETLSKDVNDPLNQILLSYCLPTLREKYADRVLKEVPDIHKKAIIACHVASRIIYRKGLSWAFGKDLPASVLLPILYKDKEITSP